MGMKKPVAKKVTMKKPVAKKVTMKKPVKAGLKVKSHNKLSLSQAFSKLKKNALMSSKKVNAHLKLAKAAVKKTAKKVNNSALFKKAKGVVSNITHFFKNKAAAMKKKVVAKVPTMKAKVSLNKKAPVKAPVMKAKVSLNKKD